MGEIPILRIFSLLVGVTGIAVALGIMFVPHIISGIEKRLDRTFSTENIEQMLNRRRNLSEFLLKHPKIFGLLLLGISFLLLVTSLLFI